jgi:hypothetical protein
MTQLIIFPSSKYTNDQNGFNSALKNNDIKKVNVDNGECSYGIMYNVSGAVQAMVELTGVPVNFGVYGDNDVYVSIDDLDNMAYNMNSSWDSLDDGFEQYIKSCS